jgi:hypothetical protein
MSAPEFISLEAAEDRLHGQKRLPYSPPKPSKENGENGFERFEGDPASRFPWREPKSLSAGLLPVASFAAEFLPTSIAPGF